MAIHPPSNGVVLSEKIQARRLTIMSAKAPQKNQPEPIDFVITWVDGGDPEHKAKRAEYQNSPGHNSIQFIPAGAAESRFQDNGELKLCLNSIIKFAPWYRRIFLITDSQRPTYLTENVIETHRITIVDHRTIFRGYEEFLPTFNSRSIESLMWRIPGLAEKFVYLNDDFMLASAANPRDYFIENKPVLHGSWTPIGLTRESHFPLLKFANSIVERALKKPRSMHALAQKRGAKTAGMRFRYYHFLHNPHPVRVSTLQAIYEENRSLLTENISFRYRDMAQHLPVSLANHLEIKNHTAILNGKSKGLHLAGRAIKPENYQSLSDLINDENLKWICVNSLEEAHDITRKKLYQRLQSITQSLNCVL